MAVNPRSSGPASLNWFDKYRRVLGIRFKDGEYSSKLEQNVLVGCSEA